MWPKKRRSDDDFQQEIQVHVALEADRLVAEGLSPEEARLRAMRTFGNVLRAQERFYESQRVMWWDDFRRDLGYGVRGLAKNYGFAAAVVLTLALGIGASTAIFSLVNAVLLKPLPYKDSDRLVRLIANAPAAQGSSARRASTGISLTELVELRSSMKTLFHLGVYAPSWMTLTSEGEAVRLEGMRISPAIFQALGVRPLLGRVFRVDEERPGATPVVVLSHSIWHRVFGGNAKIVGTAITLEDNLLRMIGSEGYAKQFHVIGVMPEGFAFQTGKRAFGYRPF